MNITETIIHKLLNMEIINMPKIKKKQILKISEPKNIITTKVKNHAYINFGVIWSSGLIVFTTAHETGCI